MKTWSNDRYWYGLLGASCVKEVFQLGDLKRVYWYTSSMLMWRIQYNCAVLLIRIFSHLNGLTRNIGQDLTFDILSLGILKVGLKSSYFFSSFQPQNHLRPLVFVIEGPPSFFCKINVKPFKHFSVIAMLSNPVLKGLWY